MYHNFNSKVVALLVIDYKSTINLTNSKVLLQLIVSLTALQSQLQVELEINKGTFIAL